MNRLLVLIYGLVPKKLKEILGQSHRIKGLRRRLLYSKNGFKTAKVLVDRTYVTNHVNFNFVASIKDASKAKQVGIENTVLRNSMLLTDKYFTARNDLTVLDVGSNFGYLASVWAASVALKGNVMAFEPNRNLFAAIEKTIILNPKFITNFKAFNVAVGSKKGTVTLNASAFSSNTNRMPSAIAQYDVEMIKLDTFVKEQQIEHIDLLKIDVDGIELDILNGAASILKKNRTLVIVETNDDHRIIDFFKQLEYQIYDMHLNVFEESKKLPLNIFCIPKSFRK